MIKEFNLLAKDNKNFKNFDDLQNQLNNYNLEKTYINIKWDYLFKLINLDIDKETEIKTHLLRFYNIFAKIYGKENIFKMLYRIGIKIFNNSTIGQIKYWYYNINFNKYWIQVMGLSKTSFDKNLLIM